MEIELLVFQDMSIFIKQDCLRADTGDRKWPFQQPVGVLYICTLLV